MSAAGILALAAAGQYLAAGATLIYSTPAPDGRERIDFYTPTRWQALFLPRFDMPAVARLTRTADNASLGESGPFDLSGEGRVIWTDKVVQVGTSAVYDRARHRWTIIQE